MLVLNGAKYLVYSWMFLPFASLAIRFFAFITETLNEKLARCKKGRFCKKTWYLWTNFTLRRKVGNENMSMCWKGRMYILKWHKFLLYQYFKTNNNSLQKEPWKPSKHKQKTFWMSEVTLLSKNSFNLFNISVAEQNK